MTGIEANHVMVHYIASLKWKLKKRNKLPGLSALLEIYSTALVIEAPV
jgi:hypothetical protein